MIRNIALFLFMLVPSLSNAQLDSQFTFNGQNAEVLKSEKKITIVTPEVVEYPDTCSRQVPDGQREVCRNETRYRQDCTWIPDSQRCWTDYDRVCRPVTRYREECSNGPSRRVCTDRPTRQVCTDRPSREVCTERPTREVCTERPTRQVCRTRPDGREHCTTVGGGQSCRTVGGGQSCTTVGGGQSCTTVGGGQSCHDVPGERQCRTVAYTDQDCDNVARQRCETVPGRNDCRDIPYSEQVCGMETQYRTESYACTRTQTVNRTTHKTVKAETNVQIVTNGLVEEFPVGVSIKEKDQQFTAFSIDTKLMKEPEVLVVLKKQQVKIASQDAKEIQLKGDIILEVLSKEMLPLSFPTAVAEATLEEASKKLVIVLEGPISALGEVDMKITFKPFLRGTRTIAELKGAYPSEKIQLGVVGDKAALSIDLTEAMKDDLRRSNMKLTLKLSSELSIQGTLMNAKKPDTSKLYQGTFVQLK